MKRISVKLAIFFIKLIVISSVISMVISTLFDSGVKQELQMHQEGAARAIVSLSKHEAIALEEIVQAVSSAMFSVKLMSGSEVLDLPLEVQGIANDTWVQMGNGKFDIAYTILKVNDAFVRIGFTPHNTLLRTITSRIWFTVFTYTIVGSLLTLLVASKVVKPITTLTLATKEVAKGNFDVEVNTNRDDEIGELTEQFNRMIIELRRIEYLRKDFISNVSHEFKTPLASIQGFAKLLAKNELTASQRNEYSKIIVEETKRLIDLSSNILKLSKLENQEHLDEKTTFLLDEQIRRSLLLLERGWVEKGIELDLRLEKMPFCGDEELLHHVWMNLLANAIKFSNEGDVIAIYTKACSKFVEVTIADKGIGMSAETLSRIFEKFFQGESARSSDGNGLGLSLAKRIVDLHGGTISVSSSEGKGTTFVVKLPIEG